MLVQAHLHLVFIKKRNLFFLQAPFCSLRNFTSVHFSNPVELRKCLFLLIQLFLILACSIPEAELVFPEMLCSIRNV